jgi:hypothetical protein
LVDDHGFFWKLFFSIIAIAVPGMFWNTKYRSTHWREQRAIVKRVQIARVHINPGWLVTLAYEFEGKPYAADVHLSERDWLGGVIEHQKVMVRIQPNSPKNCFVVTGQTKPNSNFFNCVVTVLGAICLTVIWVI